MSNLSTAQRASFGRDPEHRTGRHGRAGRCLRDRARTALCSSICLAVSRRSAPTVVIGDWTGSDHDEAELVRSVFEARYHRGAGNRLFAATGVGLARGMSMPEAPRLGTAAGSFNATRRGLGTDTRDEIEQVATHVVVRPGLR